MKKLKCVMFVVSLFGCSLAVSAGDEFILPTHQGPARGRLTEDGGAFIPNVPYMQEPVGELRFKAPRPPKMRDSMWDGTAKKVIPAQTASIFSGVENAQQLGQPIGKEGDAAYLNIFTPDATANKKRPILVWYHGGSNLQGYASDPLYDATELAKSLDAIVVTVNYRLGIFGSFYHPALEGQNPADGSGNYVTLDGIQALKWVRENIAVIGGDINNITVAGESAGGINVWGLLQSPLARGLFARAYVASAFPNNFPKMVARSSFEKFINEALVLKGQATNADQAKQVLAKMSNKQVYEFVHSLSMEEALKASTDLLPIHHIADGHVLPASGMAALPALTNRVPIMVTTTAQEGNFFFAQSASGLSEKEYWNVLTDKTEPTAFESLVKSKKYGEFRKVADDFTTTVNQLVDTTLFISGTLTTPIYRANIEIKSQQEPYRSVLGASHGMDLLALFTPKKIGRAHV